MFGSRTICFFIARRNLTTDVGFQRRRDRLYVHYRARKLEGNTFRVVILRCSLQKLPRSRSPAGVAKPRASRSSHLRRDGER